MTCHEIDCKVFTRAQAPEQTEEPGPRTRDSGLSWASSSKVKGGAHRQSDRRPTLKPPLEWQVYVCRRAVDRILNEFVFGPLKESPKHALKLLELQRQCARQLKWFYDHVYPDKETS